MKIIKELLKELEELRTKDELERYVKEIYETKKRSRELRQFSRLHKAKLKEFWQELIPLYRYTQSRFASNTARYKIIIGNQKYDAIEVEDGNEIKLEFSEFYDGKKYNNKMKELNRKGIFTYFSDYIKDKEDFLKGFNNNVKKKSKKGYCNTRIIFIISLHKHDFLAEEELPNIKRELISIIKKYDFGTNQVFLMIRISEFLDDMNEGIEQIY